jgi:voltage-gated potassium channel
VTATTTSPALKPDPEGRAARLKAWESRTTSWIIVSALVPIATAFGPDNHSAFKNVINVACWLVFLVDLVVHIRLSDRYLSRGRGQFDLSIVLITAPWFIITGGGSQFVVLARLARLGRVVMASTRSNKLKHLVNQLGNVAIYALGLVFVAALIEHTVEPASSGFTTYGDSVWWGFVTLTTVGYGDIVPVTSAGRVTAVVLMLGGVAFLGTLAGTLAAFFGVGADGKPVQYDDAGNAIVIDVTADTTTLVDVPLDAADSAAAVAPVDASALSAEVVALRETVHALITQLNRGSPPVSG